MCFSAFLSVTTDPGGPGLAINDTAIYGNDVIPRRTYIQGGGRKSWLLFQRPLSEGILERFYVYVHSVDQTRIVQSSVELRLQIWREVPSVAGTYRLLYERAVNVDHSTNDGVYYVVSI